MLWQVLPNKQQRNLMQALLHAPAIAVICRSHFGGSQEITMRFMDLSSDQGNMLLCVFWLCQQLQGCPCINIKGEWKRPEFHNEACCLYGTG